MKSKMKLVHEYQAKDGFYFQIEYRNNIYNVYVSHKEYGAKLYCFGCKNELKKIEKMIETSENNYIKMYREIEKVEPIDILKYRNEI